MQGYTTAMLVWTGASGTLHHHSHLCRCLFHQVFKVACELSYLILGTSNSAITSNALGVFLKTKKFLYSVANITLSINFGMPSTI